MAQAKKFGAFSGVFTPSILTILGVIMYLRLPTIIGQAGLWLTLGIIMLAHVISLSTGLSVSSIATDKKVKAGGTYYMISRSLGLPIGGTLGLALFVGLSFSVSLYLIGFSESFLGYWGFEVTKNTIRICGSIMLLIVTTVTLISTSLALKTQFFIMAAIALSLASIVFGNHDLAPAEPLLEAIPTAAPFIVLFGIFFPAVTGFEAGVSMSGDLKDPKKDIPSGTMWAIGVGLVVYILLAIFFAYTVGSDALTNNPNVLLEISLYAPLVVAGIWGATISSALGSILGAPRILQATAQDRITPRFLGKGYGKENEPRHALIFTFLIAEAGILIGELDVIARVVSMFFITTYGFLNLSCAIESWASPDFRPEFKIPKTVSIIGAVACFVVMIQLDFVAMVAASIVLAGVYLYLKRKELTLESGDTWEGVWSSLIRTGLERLNKNQVHVRNWRPNILLFSGGTRVRPHLLELGQRLVHRRGLLSNFDLIETPDAAPVRPRLAEAFSEDEDPPGVFSRRLPCQDIYNTIGTIASYYGYAGVEPNTVFLGWARNTKSPERFVELLLTLESLDLNTLLLKYSPERGFGERKQIDIWWRGEGANIGLALGLIRFLTSSDDWARARVRLIVINNIDVAIREHILKRLDDLLLSYRIEAEAMVINDVVDQRPTEDIIAATSATSDLTILGLPPMDVGRAEALVAQTGTLIDRLGSVLLIKASTYFQAVSLGIEAINALPEAARAPQEADDTAEAPLHLPAPLALQQPVLSLQEGFAAVHSDYSTAYLSRMYGGGARLLEQLQQLIEHTFSPLKRTLKQPERLRVARTLQKSTGSFLFQAQRILQQYAEEDLKGMETFLGEGMSWLSQQTRAMVDLLPERVQYAQPIPTTAAVAATPGMRWLPRIGFPLRRLFGQTQVERSVLLGPTAQRVVDVHLPPICQAVAEQFARDHYEVVWDAQRLIHGTLAVLAHLEGAVKAHEKNLVGRLGHEYKALASTIQSVTEAQQQRLGKTEKRVQHALTGTVQHFATALRTTDAWQPWAPPQPQVDLQSLLDDLPTRWQTHQHAIANRARMEVTMLAFSHRLTSIIERFSGEVEEHVRAALASLQSLKEDLATYATQGEEAPPFRGRYEFRQPLVVEPLLDALLAELRQAEEAIPEAVLTLRDDDVQQLKDDPLTDTETITVSLRRLVDYMLQLELLGPVQDELMQWPQQVQAANLEAQDVYRLAIFHLGDPEPESGTSTEPEEVRSILSNAMVRLNRADQEVEQLMQGLPPLLESRLDVIRQHLNVYAITQSEGHLEQYIRSHRGRVVLSRFKGAFDTIQSSLSQRLVQLIYQRSKGVLYSRRIRGLMDPPPVLASQSLPVVDEVSPNKTVLQDVPFYYRMLFLGTPSMSKDLWVGWEEQQQQAKVAIERYLNGIQGALLVTGDPKAGKSTLANLIAHRHFKATDVHTLVPPEGGSTDPEVFQAHLLDALGHVGSVDEAFRQLPPGSALIIYDIEQWWSRSQEGYRVLDAMLHYIDAYASHCLFILCVNTWSWRIMEQVHDLGHHLIDVIHCTPVNAETLRNIVMLRHASTGVKFVLNGTPEDKLSDWKLAKHFDALFDYALGNVGVALQAWISHIIRIENHQLVIETPEPVAVDFIGELEPLQRGLLIQLLLHGPISPERLLPVTPLLPDDLERELRGLRRAGLVEVTTNGNVRVQPFIAPHLIPAFAREELLP